MKITAARIGWPTREIALLIADASPALWTGTLDISVDVSGATTSEIPTPNRRVDGSTSTSVDGGGMRLAGFSINARHGADADGIRASQSRPAAISSGPILRNDRAPRFPAAAPTFAEKSVRMIPTGRPIAPEAVAV